MPTYTALFYLFDPADPPPAGTTVSPVALTITDANNDGDFDRRNGDSVDGVDIVRSYPNDVIVVNVPGQGNVTYTGTTFYLADGRRVFTTSDGQQPATGTFVETTDLSNSSGGGRLLVSDLTPACFTRGTFIETASGPRLIEHLKTGDMIMTYDHGPKPIVWVGKTKLDGLGKNAPVCFDEGAIGNCTALSVSPQHRMLLTGWKAQLYFGAREVLVAAKFFLNNPHVRSAPCKTVEYFHILLENHELIQSHGVFSESFFPGYAFETSAAHRNITRRFLAGNRPYRLIRPEAKRHEAELIAA